MLDWVKDELMEEQGYVICPICYSPNNYTMCDEDCEHCHIAKEYEEYMRLIHAEENE